MRCFYERLTGGPSKLLDTIEAEVKEGGHIIDWHACELFPQSWIDLVVVLRTDSTLLYDRLSSRLVANRARGRRRAIDMMVQELPSAEAARELGLGDHAGLVGGSARIIRCGHGGGAEERCYRRHREQRGAYRGMDHRLATEQRRQGQTDVMAPRTVTYWHLRQVQPASHPLSFSRALKRWEILFFSTLVISANVLPSYSKIGSQPTQGKHQCSRCSIRYGTDQRL